MAFAGCGPDARPEEPCNGPSFNLVVRAEGQPLPPDTRLNVRYGANPDGEPYVLGKTNTPQAVRCTEDSSPGGAPAVEAAASAAGTGGAGGEESAEPSSVVWALRCLLYTQGPANVDVTATGFETIKDRPLAPERKRRCEVDTEVVLEPVKLKPKAED